MRYVSHLACPTCGATYPADRVMNLCERDGRPVQMVLDLERLKAERGRDGWLGPDPPRPLAVRRAAAARRRRPGRPPARRRAGRGAHAVPRLRPPLADRLALPAGGQGRGPPSPRLRRQPDALVQGPGDGDDRLDGPGPRPVEAGGADPGERGRLAGRIRRRRRDRGGGRDVARHRPARARQGRRARQAPSRTVTLELVAGHDHRLRPASPRALRPAGLLQRRDLPGARLADRGEEDARPGDGRAARRPAGRADAGSSPT